MVRHERVRSRRGAKAEVGCSRAGSVAARRTRLVMVALRASTAPHAWPRVSLISALTMATLVTLVLAAKASTTARRSASVARACRGQTPVRSLASVGQAGSAARERGRAGGAMRGGAMRGRAGRGGGVCCCGGEAGEEGEEVWGGSRREIG